MPTQVNITGRKNVASHELIHLIYWYHIGVLCICTNLCLFVGCFSIVKEVETCAAEETPATEEAAQEVKPADEPKK